MFLSTPSHHSWAPISPPIIHSASGPLYTLPSALKPLYFQFFLAWLISPQLRSQPFLGNQLASFSQPQLQCLGWHLEQKMPKTCMACRLPILPLHRMPQYDWWLRRCLDGVRCEAQSTIIPPALDASWAAALPPSRERRTGPVDLSMALSILAPCTTSLSTAQASLLV